MSRGGGELLCSPLLFPLFLDWAEIPIPAESL